MTDMSGSIMSAFAVLAVFVVTGILGGLVANELVKEIFPRCRQCRHRDFSHRTEYPDGRGTEIMHECEICKCRQYVR
jgi:hypothetical protein